MRRETWIVDWARDLWTLCDSCTGDFGAGVWSPDGRRLLINGKNSLIVHALDSASPDQELLHEDGHTVLPTQWLPDGRMVYVSTSELVRWEIKVIEPGAHVGRMVLPLGTGSEPDVSPDGKWLAFTASRGEQDVVMVQAFPGPGSQTQVSAGGGSNPAWSGDGRTLFYLGRQSAGGPSTLMMAVDIHPSSTLEAGKPRELFRRLESQRCAFNRCYDLVPDGSRFLLRDRTSTTRESVSRMDLVLDWTATLPRSR